MQTWVRSSVSMETADSCGARGCRGILEEVMTFRSKK